LPMTSVSRERKGKGVLTIESAFTAASGGRAICMARRPRPELPRASRQNALGVPREDFYLIFVRDFRAQHFADLLRQTVAVRILGIHYQLLHRHMEAHRDQGPGLSC